MIVVTPVAVAGCIIASDGEYTMPLVPAFYSIDEAKKPFQNRVHHNNSNCPPGRDIPLNERHNGTGNYRLCDDCKKLNDQER